MHPPTVVAMIAVQLLGMGALFLYASRRLPDLGLLWSWAIASIAMGAAHAARWFIGIDALPPSTVWIDMLMVLSPLLYIVGTRELLAQGPLGVEGDTYAGHDTAPLQEAARTDEARRSLRRRQWRSVLAVAAAFLVVQTAVTYGVSARARFVLLYGLMGLLYACMGVIALRGIAGLGRESAMRWPIAAFGTSILLLALLTLLRAGVIVRDGPVAVAEGWFTTVYFCTLSVMVVLIAVIVVWSVFARMSDALHRLARHDRLTGALNRHGLDEAIERHFARGDAPAMALLALDIDHFKRINDSHGHAIGDVVLRAVVRSLLAHCRSDDIVARTGGEEFLVAHATPDPDRALALAERLREAVAAVRVRGRLEDEIHCTVSVGVSDPFDRLADRERAAAEADRALYAAKANGRNRCERAGRTQPSTLASVSSASSSIQSTTDLHTNPTTLSR